VFLIDTNVISEARKQARANPGVTAFFRQAAEDGQALYLSAVTVGELRRGVELIRHRGDGQQAATLEAWLTGVLQQYGQHILPFDADAAQVWGRLCVPHAEHTLDKQIAAIALVNSLTVVTRNSADFMGASVPVLNPFSAA
jgi:hypothetical protein